MTMFHARVKRIASLFLLAAAVSIAQPLTPVWVELGPAKQVLARVVIRSGSECPALLADGRPLAMKLRSPVPANFEPACEAIIPANTRKLRAGRRNLRLPASPKTVVVIGDTGCRIKGTRIQDCADPEKWPFALVASQIAKTRPGLIVHVGDYLYREEMCPDNSKGCGGPYGDNWITWQADFFAPAAAALEAAPWAFSRGNHETCDRAWQGWFYYLDPRPFSGACSVYSVPYVATSGNLRIGMFDSSATAAKIDPAQVDRFTAQLSTFAGQADWIADHHPFWYYSGTGMGTTPAVAAAWNRTTLSGVRFLLSGHLHLFQFLGFTETLPNQLIAGDGGTALSQSVKSDFAGLRWMAWGSSPAKASICLVSLRSDVSGMAGISR
jgi:hypothetical protein